MKGFFQYLVDRAQERSTYLGVIGILASVGVNVAPELNSAIMSAGIGVAGIIGVVTKDKNSRNVR